MNESTINSIKSKIEIRFWLVWIVVTWWCTCCHGLSWNLLDCWLDGELSSSHLRCTLLLFISLTISFSCLISIWFVWSGFPGNRLDIFSQYFSFIVDFFSISIDSVLFHFQQVSLFLVKGSCWGEPHYVYKLISLLIEHSQRYYSDLWMISICSCSSYWLSIASGLFSFTLLFIVSTYSSLIIFISFDQMPVSYTHHLFAVLASCLFMQLPSLLHKFSYFPLVPFVFPFFYFLISSAFVLHNFGSFPLWIYFQGWHLSDVHMTMTDRLY